MSDPQLIVINELSRQIWNLIRAQAEEQYSPRLSADDMDDYIRECREKAKKLRQIREEYENFTSGVLG